MLLYCRIVRYVNDVNDVNDEAEASWNFNPTNTGSSLIRQEILTS